jgi:hypothetical protein
MTTALAVRSFCLAPLLLDIRPSHKPGRRDDAGRLEYPFPCISLAAGAATYCDLLGGMTVCGTAYGSAISTSRPSVSTAALPPFLASTPYSYSPLASCIVPSPYGPATSTARPSPSTPVFVATMPYSPLLDDDNDNDCSCSAVAPLSSLGAARFALSHRTTAAEINNRDNKPPMLAPAAIAIVVGEMPDTSSFTLEIGGTRTAVGSMLLRSEHAALFTH